LNSSDEEFIPEKHVFAISFPWIHFCVGSRGVWSRDGLQTRKQSSPPSTTV